MSDTRGIREPLNSALFQFARAELNAQQPAAVYSAAQAIRRAVNRGSASGDTVVAVLFYGSCLRTGIFKDKVLDFYILVEDYRSAYASRLMGYANRLLPPNVFYLESPCADEAGGAEIMRLKYAVVGLDDFVRRAGGDILDLTIWARFSQPSALVFVRDREVEAAVTAAVASAARTALSLALPLVGAGATSRDIWSKAFSLTYSVELRSESAGKGAELYQLDQARYDALTPLILDGLGVARGEGPGGGVELTGDADPAAARRSRRRWMLRRLNGKAASVLRLLKAAFTFDGGIDYLAWKISRHSGVEIEIKPWQRRHPVLAGLLLFWSLRRRGAFR